MDRTNLEKVFNHRVESGCSMKVAAEMFEVKKTTLVVSLQIINSFLLSAYLLITILYAL